MNLAPLLALCALLGPASRSPNDAAIGVLIGVHHHADFVIGMDPSRAPAGGSLRTIWIPVDSPAGVSGTPVVHLTDLLLPRRTGFSRAGLLATCAEEVDDEGRTETTVSDYLWFTPAGRTPAVTLRPDPAGRPQERVGPCHAGDIRCVNDTRTTILWVWPDYVSMNSGGEYSCGAHPGWNSEPTVRQVKDPSRPLTIAEILGPAAQKRVGTAFESAKREHFAEDCKDYSDPVEFDPLAWSIHRLPGGWRITGWAETHRLCGYGFTYTAEVDLSAVTGARAPDGTALRRAQRREPRVEDAHAGPAGWTLARTATELLLLPPTASPQAVVRVPISRDDTVVMVEWATGSNVQRWSAEVERARTAGPMKPRIIQR